MNGNKFATGQILRKTGRSCEGADFIWLSSEVSQTLIQFTMIENLIFKLASTWW